MRAHHSGGGGRRRPLRRVRRQAVADALPDSIVLARRRPLWHLLGVTSDSTVESLVTVQVEVSSDSTVC